MDTMDDAPTTRDSSTTGTSSIAEVTTNSDDDIEINSLSSLPLRHRESSQRAPTSSLSLSHHEELGEPPLHYQSSSYSSLSNSFRTKSQTQSPLIKVFHASPLAYEDWTGNANPISRLDFDAEQAKITEAVEGTGIRVEFEIATADRLGLFLSQGNRFLHFSCHGHPQYIFIENDHGGAQTLLVDDNLQAWIQEGGSQLSLVLVSACHSRSAGEAFVRAGAKHVVCCERDDQLMSNTAAMIFSREFYRSLALGQTVQKAYNLAIHMVRQSPEMRRTGLNVSEEANKFALLPERGTNHDISPFVDEEGNSLLHNASIRNNSSMSSLPLIGTSEHAPKTLLPMPPDSFVGRELDMYQILKSLLLLNCRLVRIVGKKGIGKDCLARAIANFVARRNMWGHVLWMTSTRQGEEGDILTNLEQLREVLEESTLDARQLASDRTYRRACQAVTDQLYDQKALLIINASRMSSPNMKEYLGVFLDDIFELTRNVKVILIHPKSKAKRVQSMHPTGFDCTETELELLPLDFTSTVDLFGRMCPYSNSSGLRWNRDVLFHDARQSDATKLVLGGGNPAKTIIAAREMSKQEYATLMSPPAVTEQDFPHLIPKVRRKFSNNPPNSSSATFRSSGAQTSTLRPPLRSQQEVQLHFAPLLIKEGRVHRKSVMSYLRRAIRGEKIVTTIDGVQESEKTVQDDTSWVACGKAAGEYYVLSKENCEECYDLQSARDINTKSSSTAPISRRLHQQGFREYKSKRQVWARKVTEEDMQWFRHGFVLPPSSSVGDDHGAFFVAPWGESMRVEQGDILVMQYPGGNNEIYRVEHNVFEYSYEAVDSSLVSSINNRRRWMIGASLAAMVTLSISWMLCAPKTPPRKVAVD